MASETMSVAGPHVELQISTLLDRIEAMRQEQLEQNSGPPRLLPMQAEMRTLEFWRSVIAECIATFLFVFIVCGAVSSSVTGYSPTSTILASAASSGLAIAALSSCFFHVSGAHINPAISVAMAFTKQISTFRAFMFVIAQCGGGIAGAAILYGISNPSIYITLNARSTQNPFHMTPWDRFASEMVLTFVVVFTYFITTDQKRKLFNRPHLPVACAYFACGLVAMPSLNPARALGPAFVTNKWIDHWVHWCGPISGGILAAFIYEHIFNSNRHSKHSSQSVDGDSSSIHSDEDTYDDLDKPRSNYNTLRAMQSGTELYRPITSHNPASPNGIIHGYCPTLTPASLYSTAPSKLDRVESLYAGTKSLYSKSPVLTRANLHRSQSVYTKSPNCQPMAPMTMRESPPRPGPLIPAQSLYPMRLNTVSAPSPSNSSISNQNQQNQQRLGAENVYGVRSAITNTTGVYGKQTSGHVDSMYGNGGNNSNNSNSKHGKRELSNDYAYNYHSSNSANQKSSAGNYGSSGLKSCNSYHNGMSAGPRSDSMVTHGASQMQQSLGIPTVGPPPPYLQHTVSQPSPGSQY